MATENPWEITPERIKKVSEKHNFVKTFIGKIKAVLKSPNFLGLKRRASL